MDSTMVFGTASQTAVLTLLACCKRPHKTLLAPYPQTQVFGDPTALMVLKLKTMKKFISALIV